MKANAKRRLSLAMLFGILMFVGVAMKGMTVNAEGDEVDFDFTAGAAKVVEADIFSDDETVEELIEKKTQEYEEEVRKQKERETFVMAKVDKSVNVRTSADENSERVGLMYHGCGGQLLDKASGWTKIQSGELIGWVKDDFLLFGEEAEVYAKEVGITIATVETQTLRVRAEASEEAKVRGLLELKSSYDVISDQGDWIEINYNDKPGFVAREYVSLYFYVEEGETMEQIREREELARLEKAKLTAPQTPLALSDAELYLLGAIVQCEAGNQSYEGKLAVAAVVCNRVRSGKFPNTVTEVIYSPHQFTPAGTGALEVRLAAGVSDSCLKAAMEAASGVTNVGTAHYFKRKGNKKGVILGAHVFY